LVRRLAHRPKSRLAGLLGQQVSILLSEHFVHKGHFKHDFLAS
jgi:hypothetical protein